MSTIEVIHRDTLNLLSLVFKAKFVKSGMHYANNYYTITAESENGHTYTIRMYHKGNIKNAMVKINFCNTGVIISKPLKEFIHENNIN